MFAFAVAYHRARRTARRPAGWTRNSLQPRRWSKSTKGRRALSGPRKEEGQAIASCSAAPLPLAPVAAGRVQPRRRRLRRELRVEPPLLPIRPPPAPSAPRGSSAAAPPAPLGEGGGGPSWRRWEQITVQSTGHLSQGCTHVPKAGYLETLSFLPALCSPLASARSLPRPLRFSSHPSPLLRFVLSPPPLPVSSPGCPPTDAAFPPPPVGAPPGESAVDWCLYQLNGAAEFEVSEGEYGALRWDAARWPFPRPAARGRLAGSRPVASKRGGCAWPN